MSSARLAWNALLPMMTQSIERQRARDSVWTLLNCITATTDKRKYLTSEVCSLYSRHRRCFRHVGIGS